MKKYLIPLIFILLLTFALAGYGADLFGTYDKRIKLTIDNTKIDSALSDFPVTVFFTSTQAEEIFTEFDADSDYMKCAFTSSDGTTQLYAEKELFDDSESKAIYHVKVTSVSSSAGTDIYYYYDNDASDNTTYIGAINTTAGGHVWDSNFKAVYHMTDATTSTILDSTSNNEDGTKKGANEPIEVTGKIGQAQSFDGDDDKISKTDNEGLSIQTNITIEVVPQLNNYNTGIEIYEIFIAKGSDYKLYYRQKYNSWYFSCFDTSNAFHYASYAADETIGAGDWFYMAGVYNGTTMTLYNNGAEKDTTDAEFTIRDTADDLFCGLDGLLDEVRLSNIARSAAWIKATYNSLWDSLVSYSSEETKPSKNNSIMFGMNF